MKQKGPEGFDHYYRTIFTYRWDQLKAALMEENRPQAFEVGLLKPYYLDEASVMCAQCLGVKPGQEVLDLCAAPGGKTLVLAQALQAQGQLISNEKSPDRRRRLKQVLSDHLPQAESFVKVTGFDASQWGLHEQNKYDRVLLDAPCSSERHVLSSPTHLAQWSPARSKHLAIQQFAMLAGALEALKPGGILVYSTCSISSLENDDVIAKLHKKRPGQFTVLDPDLPYGEKTTFGVLILPDRCQGKGPLFVCKLKKKADPRSLSVEPAI